MAVQRKTKKQPALKPAEKSKLRQGLVICYIGAGKGKTTAAMGVVARAAGSGMNVHVLQFVKASAPKKGQKKLPGEWSLSNEIIFFNSVKPAKNIGMITTEVLGKGFVGILGDTKERKEHIAEAKRALAKSKQILKSKKYDVVFLDELVSAVELKLLSQQDVVDVIKVKSPQTHLIITGHNNFPKIIKHCDLVTEMKMIKHPYYKGILAQRGIDF